MENCCKNIVKNIRELGKLDQLPKWMQLLDTRMLLHVYRSILDKANDTDVLVLAVRAMALLKHQHLQHLWVAVGGGKTLR